MKRKASDRRFVVEVVQDGMVRYMYTRRVSVTCIELAQRFLHRKSANHFYKTSIFAEQSIPMEIRVVSAKTLLPPEQQEG